jgi:hypothetical protein
MLIHSDTLTPTDIFSVVPTGCYLAVFDHPGFGNTRVGISGSRTHERKFTVRLSGSTRNAMRNLPDMAATWDEWGIFIAALFKLDSNAKIGWYGSQDNFIEQTTNEHNRIKLYRSDLLPTHSAPWLAHN